MAIPPFNEAGLLPPGIHVATLAQVIGRFGRPAPQRSAIGESICWAVDSARRAGVIRFVVDGSFVDAKREPNDADCVLLLGPNFPADEKAARELEEGLPYLDLIVFESEVDFNEFLTLKFSTDRAGRTRGLIEVDLA